MPSAEIKRLLVVKLADIGDVLTATPALRALRRSLPDARIDVLLTPNSAPVLEDSPLADEVISFDKFAYDRMSDALRPRSFLAALGLGRLLRRKHYDALVLLHHLTTRWGALKYALLAWAVGAPVRAGLDNGRGFFLTHRAEDRGFGHRHEVEYCLDVVRLLGAENPDPVLEFYPSEEDALWAESILRGRDRPVVVIHPGSGGYSPARRWPAEHFARLADELAARKATVILVGTPADEVSRVARLTRSRPLNLEGRTTLGRLGALLAGSDLFVGADSGVMHLAAAMRVPLVAIFGPTNPRAWGPWTPHSPSRVVRLELPCSPCSYVDFTVNREGCPSRRCMTHLEVEYVLEAVEEMLGMSGGRR